MLAYLMNMIELTKMLHVQCIERAKQNKETTPLQESKQLFDFAGTDSFNHTPPHIIFFRGPPRIIILGIDIMK